MRRRFRKSDLLAILHDRQGGKCAICGHTIGEEEQFHADHIIPLAIGGEDSLSNIQIVHAPCHRSKTKDDVKTIAKVRRIRNGGRKRKGRPMPGSRLTPWKKKLNGRTVRRKERLDEND